MMGMNKIFFAIFLVVGSIDTLYANEQQVTSAHKEIAIDSKVNINTATAEELAAKLRGIGLKKAEAIVEYRNQYGLFTDVDQLQEVPGIGSILLERNLAFISL